MEILGVGPMELIVILLLLLLVFGPERLPEIGAKLGKGVRSMRQATRDFSEELQQARDAIEKPASEIVAPIQQIAQPIQQAAQPFQDLKASALALSQAAQGVRDPLASSGQDKASATIRDSVVRSVKGDTTTGGDDGQQTVDDKEPSMSAGEAASSPAGEGELQTSDGRDEPTEAPKPAASDLAG